MSRKHYVAIANLLAGEHAISTTDAERERMRCVMLSMADIFAQDNDAFDRERFYMACGISRYNVVNVLGTPL